MIHIYVEKNIIGTLDVTNDMSMVIIANTIKEEIDKLLNSETLFVYSFKFFHIPCFGSPEMRYLDNLCILRTIDIMPHRDKKHYTLEKGKELIYEEYCTSGLNCVQSLSIVEVIISNPIGLDKYISRCRIRDIPESYIKFNI